jgi:hypothetical protein
MKIKTKINFAALFEKSYVIVPELWRLRQEDYQFKAILGYLVRYYLLKKIKFTKWLVEIIAWSNPRTSLH